MQAVALIAYLILATISVNLPSKALCLVANNNLQKSLFQLML
jgi:hypothetical protein